ncbi:saxitoxin and tetrodotoxin-binding protein 1-like [Eucyclogobius newberryi]|uniref:saxitoxin and tetrodotoxin-binding protein 1-like n=1 Tax=Eucyclogobius newberryi TaxID=166745 RepID=UPI003B5CB488
MKSTLKVLSLVLVLVLVWAQAAPGPKDNEPKCEGLKKTIQPQQLHKVEGDWMAVWGVSDGAEGQALIPHVISSRLKLKFLNNKTLNFHESNFYRGQTWNCSFFTMNATVVEGADKDEVQLEAHDGMMDFQGNLGPFRDNITMSFAQSCEHCLSMIYKSDEWSNFFMVYSRWGHHSDLEAVKKEHTAFQKRAECLGFPVEPAFQYQGSEGLCSDAQDQSCNQTLGPEELHQVDGDWVLVWLVYDKTKVPEVDPMPNFTSSHLELRLQPDNRTVSMHERNVYGGGKCAVYTANMTLPENHNTHHLELEGAMEHKDGEHKPHNDSAGAEFLPSSENAMILMYHSKSQGPFLLTYRREGHHRDVEVLKKDLEHHKKLSQCLSLSGDDYEEWLYDGAADFCHKKSAPEEKPDP